MRCRRARAARRGLAAVELAVFAPFLAFLFLIAVDWARVFYFSVVLENSARNGAYYASDYGLYDYQNPPDAALEDTSNLSPAPTITVAYGTSQNGPFNLTSATSGYINGSSSAYVQVTATWTFNTVANYFIPQMFQIPTSMTMQRTVVMQMAPIVPSFS